MDSALVHLGISQTLLHRLHTLPKQVHVQLLKTGTGDGSIEINSLKERVNLNGRLSSRRKGPLCPLTGSSQPSKGPGITTYVLLVFPFELLNKVVHHSIVKVLATKMGVSSSGFHLKDTLLNSEQRHIKGPTTKIENQYILLTNTGGLFVKTISNGSSSWLIDDTHDIESRDDSSIFSGLTLRVIEVGRNSYNSILHSRTEVGFCNLLHLSENH
uniref:Uncharacterized protein n=1 Tax=Opuntia streptacantha TaxID=393608 RepID=A0A7C8YMH2_OPUST